MIRNQRVKVTNDERRFYERDPWSNNTYPEINQMIKRLEKRDLLKKLYSIGVDQKGLKDFDKKRLAKRLKGHYKRIFAGESKVKEVHVECKYFVCIDFEATCEKINFVHHPVSLIQSPHCLLKKGPAHGFTF